MIWNDQGILAPNTLHITKFNIPHINNNQNTNNTQNLLNSLNNLNNAQNNKNDNNMFNFTTQNQPKQNTGFGMPMNSGFGMPMNSGFGMPQQNNAFGMQFNNYNQQNQGFGMNNQNFGAFGGNSMPKPQPQPVQNNMFDFNTSSSKFCSVKIYSAIFSSVILYFFVTNRFYL